MISECAGGGSGLVLLAWAPDGRLKKPPLWRNCTAYKNLDTMPSAWPHGLESEISTDLDLSDGHISVDAKDLQLQAAGGILTAPVVLNNEPCSQKVC